MSTAKISRRYASALYELIGEGSDLQADVANVAAVAANDEVAALLDSPTYPVSVKAQVILKAAGKVGGEVSRLVTMLAERGKACLLPEINDQLQALIHQAESRVDADVTVAVSINDATQTKLAKALAATTGKEVTLSVHEDQSILGGLIVRIGDRKIDYSLRTRLDGMRRALAS